MTKAKGEVEQGTQQIVVVQKLAEELKRSGLPGGDNSRIMTLEELRHTRRNEIMRLAAACGAGNVRVFGSVARGDADSRSDIDLLVDLEPGRSLLDLARLQRQLEQLLAVKVDVVSARGLRDRVRDTVLRDALPL